MWNYDVYSETDAHDTTSLGLLFQNIVKDTWAPIPTPKEFQMN